MFIPLGYFIIILLTYIYGVLLVNKKIIRPFFIYDRINDKKHFLGNIIKLLSAAAGTGTTITFVFSPFAVYRKNDCRNDCE
jgi:hypothetical protein